MSAKVIPISGKKKQIEQIIADAVDSNLSHKNPQVLSCLKKEIATLLEKHFTNEPPEMRLALPPDLNEDQFIAIKKSFQDAFSEHNERMIQRSNSIFLDLYLSRLEVCELKYGDKEYN